jgi:hypothetical protein
LLLPLWLGYGYKTGFFLLFRCWLLITLMSFFFRLLALSVNCEWNLSVRGMSHLGVQIFVFNWTGQFVFGEILEDNLYIDNIKYIQSYLIMAYFVVLHVVKYLNKYLYYEIWPDNLVNFLQFMSLVLLRIL